MKVDSKILQEIKRFNSINKYIVEQATDEPLDLGAPPTGDVGLDLPEPGGLGTPPTGDTSTVTPPPPPGGDMGATGATTGTTVDIANDPDVEEIGGDETPEGEEGDTEELDITDLVDTQKSMSDKQEEYFNNLFSQLQNLESKLGEMDNLVNKINDLETKFDRFRPKTPVEKLELRSLDSGPFNQKLSDFFEDKQEDMQKSGKNEYVLTTDQVEELSPREVKDTFNDFGDYDDENDMM
jgi:hypothetical protein